MGTLKFVRDRKGERRVYNVIRNRTLKRFVTNVPVHGQLRKLGREALWLECNIKRE